MTTPTHVAALVEALRTIRDNRVKPGTAVYAGGPFCFGCDRYIIAGRGHNEWRPCGVAERVLASWESRPRLREDVEARGAVSEAISAYRATSVPAKVFCAVIDVSLDAIEDRLLGGSGRGTATP